MDDPNTDNSLEMVEALRAVTVSLETLVGILERSSTRFDETVDSLTDEIASLTEQVNLNTQELGSQNDGGF